MRQIHAHRQMTTTRNDVWDVLADFANIADWNGGVKTSFATGPETGVGAMRHCDFSPVGQVEETAREWEEPSKMVISIDSTKKLPFKKGEATFRLDEADGGGSQVEIDYQYEMGWGLVGKMMGSMMDKKLAKGFDGFLEDLEKAAS